MVVGAQSEPEETMLLHLNPDEQRLVTQALAEQRIRLGSQAEGEEKLLRRMTGSVTEYRIICIKDWISKRKKK